MFQTARKTAMALALLAAFAAGGAALAGAATKGSTSSSTASSSSSASTQQRPAHRQETALTGETAANVKAAALDKVPGGTVLRVETDTDHGSPYEAHVRKSDGTEVEVLVNSNFEVTAVKEHKGRGPRGRGGRGGPHGAALTAATATNVKAAALAKVPGGTVLRAESGGPTGSAYHAHVRKSDGTEVVVLVNKDFEATAVQADKGPRRP